MFIDHYQYLNITIAVLIIEQREKNLHMDNESESTVYNSVCTDFHIQ